MDCYPIMYITIIWVFCFSIMCLGINYLHSIKFGKLLMQCYKNSWLNRNLKKFFLLFLYFVVPDKSLYHRIISDFKAFFFSHLPYICCQGTKKNEKRKKKTPHLEYESSKIQKFYICPDWCGSVVECRSAKQRIAGSIPSQGTYLGCRPGHQWGACKRQPHIDVSLPLFLPSFPSLKNK